MAKTFIRKTIDLENKKNEEKLLKAFPFLSDANVGEIKYWNGKDSPYSGSIVDGTADFPAYPYPGPADSFLKDYPEGTVWAVG
ncbi:MAG TPA: hypothetical protein PLJ21_13830 [Pseudobdellovibrionaceae bacterium]|jgi:hypothetical protein|nr:hypothetical protein [Pseudobdellovibrionaceae bacterium]